MPEPIENSIYKYWVKVKKEKVRILRKPLELLISLGITANMMSIFGLIFGITSVFFLNYSRIWFAIFWLSNRIADMLDGPIAQITNKKSSSINTDAICDFTYYSILLIAPIPITGLTLPLIALTLFFIHLALDYRDIGKRILAPNNVAQYFYLFGLLKLGLIAQIAYSGILIILHKTSHSEKA